MWLQIDLGCPAYFKLYWVVNIIRLLSAEVRRCVFLAVLT